MEGAYGAGKSGTPFDPIAFLQRPQVVLRAVSLLFGIIVFSCISSEGWLYDKQLEKDVCLYNGSSSACQYGEAIGMLAFLASIGFLIGEFLFEQFSSVKTRKHYVLIDLAFSGLWAFLYFVGFCYLTNQWSHSSTPEGNYGVNNVQAAIVFSFFSIFTWAGSAFFAYQRFRQGLGSMFATNFEGDTSLGGGGVGGGAAAYSTYSHEDQTYQEPPFSNTQHGGGGEYPAPTY